MKKLTVNLPGRTYDILIHPGLLAHSGEEIRRVCPKAKTIFLVTDTNVGPLYSGPVTASLEQSGFRVCCHVVPAGERSKCVSELSRLWEAMMGVGLTRTDAVAALGGGVVGDLAGFAAATILRGVDLIQLPTTLLAQVDSSVGGKVAIDLEAGKNLAGAFYQPKLVLMDPTVLATLPDVTFADGMAEVIKCGCILDRAFFDFLAARPSRSDVMNAITHVLYTCCDLKRQVVVADEHDTGPRMLLNFGHTIGHAYELAGHYEACTHGQAVAAGMVAAVRLGISSGLTVPDALPALTQLLQAFSLPTNLPCPTDVLARAVWLDKKGAGAYITVILLEQIGHAVPVPMERVQLLRTLEGLFT